LQPVKDIDEKADAFGTLLGMLTTAPIFSEPDVQRLRHAFYRQSTVVRRHAAEIFHANRIMRARHDGWEEFYLEALTHFFLVNHEDGYGFPAERETTLLAWLGDGVSIGNFGERRLALRLLLRATSIPHRLEQRVFDAISESLIHQPERWLGLGKRSAGVIDALDVQLIRRLLYAETAPYPRTIRPAAITFLLKLDRLATRFVNPDGWRRLLVGSIVRHLSGPPPVVPDGDTPSSTAFLTAMTTLLSSYERVEDAASLREDVLAAARLTGLGCDERPTMSGALSIP